MRDTACMAKTNILHVTFDMAIAGTEQVIRQLVENTDKQRFNCEIMCIDGKVGELGQLLAGKGFKLHTLKRKSSGLDFDLIKQLRAFVKEHNIQVLHCHQYTPYVYGLFASFGTKAQVIFTEHGRFYPDSYKWKRMLLNPVLSLFTSHITAISKATTEALVKYENFPRRKVQVIYNGINVDTESFKDEDSLKAELNIPEGARVLGTISRLDPIKNQPMMIEAFSEVLQSHPNTYLLIVGDGPERNKLETLCQILKVQDKVIFTGFKVNPQRYFNIIDIFLLSSLSEGTSMTLLEAMAFKKPAVVTDVGGNPEIVVDRETGLVTPSNDNISFCNSIKFLLESPEISQFYGHNAYLRFEKKFSAETMAQNYQNLINI